LYKYVFPSKIDNNHIGDHDNIKVLPRASVWPSGQKGPQTMLCFLPLTSLKVTQLSPIPHPMTFLSPEVGSDGRQLAAGILTGQS
jgi:hypothetical protein